MNRWSIRGLFISFDGYLGFEQREELHDPSNNKPLALLKDINLSPIKNALDFVE